MIIATRPSSTVSSKLDDNCTEEWMNIVESPSLSALPIAISVLLSRIFHRYVVIDEHQLVIYRNEEAVLRNWTRLAAE